MGRRVTVNATTAVADIHVTPASNGVKRSIRKRKHVTNGGTSIKAGRLNDIAASVHCNGGNQNYNWHENADDEDSSSNDTTPAGALALRNQSTKHANNSSILLNSSALSLSFVGGQQHNSPTFNESPKPVYVLRPSMVNGTILYDLAQKPWRLGRPIGKGNFGEIFLASDNISIPVSNDNAKYVVKVEPHSNGPLFVEIHCLLNTARKNSNVTIESEQHPKEEPSGIPDYIASGSHYFGDARYRFLVLQRFDRDLHSIIKNTRISQKSVLTLAVHIINVLENLHDKGYCHNDVKAQNLMISKCKFYKTKSSRNTIKRNNNTRHKVDSKYEEHYEDKLQTTDSGNSSEQEANDDDDDAEFVLKRKQLYDDEDEQEEDYEDFDDGATSNSNNTNSMDMYHTPVNKHSRRRSRNVVEYSGSNPVRSCRRQKRNSIYDEMVKSHYLRPTKRVSYSEFFNEDGISLKDEDARYAPTMSTDEDSEEFIPKNVRRSATSKRQDQQENRRTNLKNCKRTTRLQEKDKALQQNQKYCNTGSGSSSNSCPSNTATNQQMPQKTQELFATDEERIFLIDYGLASKFMDQGVHRPFIMDQRRAHDGTLEFTSRDAHMGAHSRRSDLECLGYNLIYWSQGFLPWKDAAAQQQQEKVHRAKEYLMTDVREMLKQIYGKQVPKYLGEFLHLVSDLAFHDRPNYEQYRQIFKREFELLGYDGEEMRLDSHEIMRTCVRVKDEIENKCDIFELNKNNALSWSSIKNCSVGTPFQESTHANSRISPKNLRSKSDKKSLKKKKFSWAEILSQDPDQIARERAEKEFDREEESNDVQQPTVRKFEGKPTYAILDVLRKLRESGRLLDDEATAVLDCDKRLYQDNGKDNTDSDMDYEEPGEDEESEEERDESEEDLDEEASETENEDNEQSMTDNEDVGDLLENSNDECDANLDDNTSRCTRNTIKRTRRQYGKRTQTKKTPTATKTNVGGRKANQTKQVSNRVAFNTKTRSSSNCFNNNNDNNNHIKEKNDIILTNTNISYLSKRGSATRQTRRILASKNNNSNSGAASAAGDIEPLRRFADAVAHGVKIPTNKDHEAQPPQRRTRRCLLKTEKAMRNAVLAEEEDSNSHFSPEMRNLYLNNESIYYRGSAEAAAAAAQHAVTTASRHYRK